MRSELSGMLTLTACSPITAPVTLNGARPSNVRTIGNDVPDLSAQLLWLKPKFQVTFGVTMTTSEMPLL